MHVFTMMLRFRPSTGTERRGLKRHFSSRDHEETTHIGRGTDVMERVGLAVTVAKGSFESKELLLCFTLLFFFF